jgi:hypothetical protein
VTIDVSDDGTRSIVVQNSSWGHGAEA